MPKLKADPEILKVPTNAPWSWRRLALQLVHRSKKGERNA